MQIVAPNGASHVTQPEFNTALALLACAQHKLGKGTCLSKVALLFISYRHQLG